MGNILIAVSDDNAISIAIYIVVAVEITIDIYIVVVLSVAIDVSDDTGFYLWLQVIDQLFKFPDIYDEARFC